jgi:aspartate-semialdehyde dehydrogenase
MSECVLGLVGASSLEVEAILDMLPDWKFRAARLQETRVFGTKMQVGRRVFCGVERLPVHETKRKDLEACDVVIVAPDARMKPHDVEALCQAGVAVVLMPGAATGVAHGATHVASVHAGFSDEEKRTLNERPLLVLADDVASLAARVLKPLSVSFGLDAAVIVSYESASGAGRAGFDVFHEELQGFLSAQDLTPRESSLYPWPMAFNVFPLDAAGLDKGTRVSRTLKDVLQNPSLRISCQLARVPVFVGHAVALTVSLARPATVERVAALFREEGFSVASAAEEAKGRSTPIVSPRQVQGQDIIGVSELRAVDLFAHGLSFWLVADNLRTGIASNALGTLDCLASSGVLSALQRRRRS